MKPENMKSKYLVFATTLLLILSSFTIISVNATGKLLAPAKVDTHGPRVDSMQWTVYNQDASLASALMSGAIQFVEWPFTLGSYNTMLHKGYIKHVLAPSYNWDGITFNMLRQYTNQTGFRKAIAYLMDYSFIGATILLNSKEGIASPYLMPCFLYDPTACYDSTTTGAISYPYSPTEAAYQLTTVVGLYTTNACAAAKNCSPAQLAALTWHTGSSSGPIYQPNFYIRTDDPIRASLGLMMTSNAGLIGLTFNPAIPGIDSNGADEFVIIPSEDATLNPGGYNVVNNLNDNPRAAYNMSTKMVGNGYEDAWDMYEYGYSGSASYLGMMQQFNTQFSGTGIDQSGGYHSDTMDGYTNTGIYATSTATAATASVNMNKLLMTDLPQVQALYQNSLIDVNVKLWTGFANLQGYAPGSTLGMFYTLLNVHQNKAATGGSIWWGEHKDIPAGGASLSPWYALNWLYAFDINQLILDAPLATPPTCSTCVNVFLNWMTTSYSIQTHVTYSAPASKAGWFDMQAVNPHGGTNVVDGQKITFTFRDNLTFSDHVPVTALDYNFSLWALAIAAPPSLPNSASFYTGSLAGPQGLVATYVAPGQNKTIEVYVNSSSIWATASIDIPIVPEHIFKYFQIDNISGSKAMNLALTYATMTSGHAEYIAAVQPAEYAGSGSNWLKNEPNFLVASGPFVFKTYDPTSGSGQVDRFTSYQRTAWSAYASVKLNAVVHKPLGWSHCATQPWKCQFTFTTAFTETLYNSGTIRIGGYGSDNRFGVFPGTGGTINVGDCNQNPANTDCMPKAGTIPSNDTNVVATVQVYTKLGVPVGTPINMTMNPGSRVGFVKATWTAVIPTLGLTKGAYEIVAIAQYGFLGLQRTNYVFSGFTVK
jgi:hypothetical protein